MLKEVPVDKTPKPKLEVVVTTPPELVVPKLSNLLGISSSETWRGHPRFSSIMMKGL